MYTESAERAAIVKIRKDKDAAISWALELIAAPVAPANQRAVAYAVYDLAIVNKE